MLTLGSLSTRRGCILLPGLRRHDRCYQSGDFPSRGVTGSRGGSNRRDRELPRAWSHRVTQVKPVGPNNLWFNSLKPNVAVHLTVTHLAALPWLEGSGAISGDQFAHGASSPSQAWDRAQAFAASLGRALPTAHETWGPSASSARESLSFLSGVLISPATIVNQWARWKDVKLLGQYILRQRTSPPGLRENVLIRHVTTNTQARCLFPR